MMGLMIGIVIFIFILLYLLFIRDRNSRILSESYKNITGHVDDENARKVVVAGGKIKNPTPLEQYRVGEVLLNNINNPNGAISEYLKAVDNIRDHPLNMGNLFILDRIEGDYNRVGVLRNNIPNVRVFVTHHINDKVNQDDRKNFIYTTTNKKDRKTETFKQKNTWVEDAQSVHDSTVSSNLQEHFDKIKMYNVEEYGELTTDKANAAINDLTNYLQSQPDHDKAMKVIERSKEGLKVMNLDSTEYAILIELWRRINSQSNVKNADELKKSLHESMSNCTENGHLVCTQGRTSRMIQSISHLDLGDPTLGLVRTDQAVRNQIYADSNRILTKHINSLSKENKDKYNKSETNSVIEKMENNARNEIRKMIMEEKDIEDKKKQTLIAECLAVV